jgi:hypothetical protein
MKAQLTILAPLIGILYPSLVLALFKCGDQNDFKPTAGKFVVHYTSTRDSGLASENPWVSFLCCQCNHDPNSERSDPYLQAEQ